MVALNYKSTAPWALSAKQFDSANLQTELLALEYPPTVELQPWNQIQAFAISTGHKMEWAVSGAGVLADVTVSSVDIRQCFGYSAVVPSSYGISGPNRFYKWNSLERRPYIVVVMFQAGGVAIGSASLDNDAVAPSLAYTQPYLATTPGVAIMAMPLNDSLNLHIPAGINPTAVYALAFDGPALPSSIQP
jgi:hypothetical protein